MANVIQTFPKGTGGHTILDTTGTSVTDRKEMQFKGLSVTDNSTDEVTEIEGVGLNQDSLNDIAGANISNVMVGSGDNYSTSEQIIGRWYDGKPIYQRTFTSVTFPLSSGSWYQTSITGTDLPNLECIIGYNVINVDDPCPNNISGSIGEIRLKNNYLEVYNNVALWQGHSIPAIVTLQYTKTT